MNRSSIPAIKNTAKISIVGLPAVGKTTLSKLIRGQQINNMYKPTMGFDLKRAMLAPAIENFKFNIWDFGGQKEFLKKHLSRYVSGSDLLFICTDSTPKNVLSTKELVEHAKDLVGDDCEIIGIANKQDLPGHMDSKRVENVLQVSTFPMVAIDPNNRDTIINLIQTLTSYVEKKKRGEN